MEIWSEPREAEEIDERSVKVKADLLSELVGVSIFSLYPAHKLMPRLTKVCIMRSEFEEAAEVSFVNSLECQSLMPAKALDKLISHSRTFDIFKSYSARITLHHAHLAHALGNLERAQQCYAVAAQIAVERSFVNVSARAGVLALKITRSEDCADEIEALVSDCVGLGSNLEAIGCILRACNSQNILGAKCVFLCIFDILGAHLS